VDQHPTVNKAVEQFRVEQQQTELLKAQLDSGDTYEKKKVTREFNDRLLELVQSYDTMPLIDYLNKAILVIAKD
jgi:hypothetical protein